MYELTIPHKNFRGEPKGKKTVQFNLEVFEVMQNFVPIAWLLEFRDDRMKAPGDETIPNELMVEFFNNFEEIILAAWGELSDDGENFDKTGVYDFKSSRLFSETMNTFVSDFTELNQFLNVLVPDEMETIVKKQVEELAKLEKQAEDSGDGDAAAELARIKAALPPETLAALEQSSE